MQILKMSWRKSIYKIFLITPKKNFYISILRQLEEKESRNTCVKKHCRQDGESNKEGCECVVYPH